MANYCTDNDVVLRLSQEAVNLRLDDLSGAGDYIEEASAEIDMMLLGRYPAARLAANPWVKFCCRSIACEFLCIRRGQDIPASIATDCERYRAQLALIASGAIRLPNTPMYPGGPGVSNQTYVNGRYPALRTERPRSVPIDKLPPRLIDGNADTAAGWPGSYG